MRIEAKLEENFNVRVRFFGAPTNAGVLGILFYSIIQAMKQHNHDAFMFAMDKFVSEELEEMIGGKEND